MKAFLFLAACLVAVSSAAHLSSHVQASFSEFKQKYGKTYEDPRSEKHRGKVYEENLRRINKHNEKYEKGEVTFKMKINDMADMLPQEFSSTFLGFNRSLLSTNAKIEGLDYVKPNKPIQKSVDLRKVGAVTPIKNQGQCGSCWSFSAVGALEGHHFLKTKKLVAFSEQNLVDCSDDYGNNGCNGGLMDQAFQYVKDKGIDTEENYPYKTEEKECKRKSGPYTIEDFMYIPEGDEQALMEAVSGYGPVSVGIDASHPTFQFYSEGVYYEPDCSSRNLDHGVLVVGYGEENGHKYWLVKNSWGTQWGDNGYIKMARGKRNNCGIATTASFPIFGQLPRDA